MTSFPLSQNAFSHIQDAICSDYVIVKPYTLLKDVMLNMSKISGKTCDLLCNIESVISDKDDRPVSCALVVDEGKLQGIVTERDLVRLTLEGKNPEFVQVAEVMNTNVVTLSLEEFTDLFVAYHLMQHHKICHLTIVDEVGYPIGIVTIGSLREPLYLGYSLRCRKIDEVVNKTVITAHASTPIIELVKTMVTNRISSVVIVESKNNYKYPIGIITERDIIHCQALKLDLHKITASLIMSSPVVSIGKNDSIITAHNLMSRYQVRRLIVQGEMGELNGIITQTNISNLFDPLELCGVLEIFQSKVQQLESQRDELLKQKELHLEDAFENQEFYLVYQPQYCHQSKQIIGAEVLIRWFSSEKNKYISPAEFIPIAEKTDFINILGDWIFRQVCQQIVDWQSRNFPYVPISINISSKQFHHPNFIDNLSQTIDEYNIDTSLLKIELTESLLVENIEHTIKTIQDLKLLGFQVAIDDFGTGYASLSYLQYFNFDILKIDQSFVRDIHKNKKNSAIVNGMIKMTQQLDLDVIAEGVETPEELEDLQQKGCHLIQGYLISRPLNIDCFETFLQEAKTKVFEDKFQDESII